MKQRSGKGRAGAYREIFAEGGVEIKFHSFLSSEPDGDEFSSLRAGWFTPEEKIIFTRHLKDV